MESESTTKVNWPRVFGCGTLAGIVWIVLGSIVTALLGRDFAALPHNRLGAPTPGFLILNVVLDLLEGLSILWLYASIRPAYRPGPRTALIAAFAWWFIVSLADVTWCYSASSTAHPNPLDDRDLASAPHRHTHWCQVLQGLIVSE